MLNVEGCLSSHPFWLESRRIGELSDTFLRVTYIEREDFVNFLDCVFYYPGRRPVTTLIPNPHGKAGRNLQESKPTIPRLLEQPINPKGLRKPLGQVYETPLKPSSELHVSTRPTRRAFCPLPP